MPAVIGVRSGVNLQEDKFNKIIIREMAFFGYRVVEWPRAGL